jgi:hypothetical protein
MADAPPAGSDRPALLLVKSRARRPKVMVFDEAELTFASRRIVGVAVVGHGRVRFLLRSAEKIGSPAWRPDPLILAKRGRGINMGIMAGEIAVVAGGNRGIGWAVDVQAVNDESLT